MAKKNLVEEVFEFNVLDEKGSFVRVYSVENHGKNAKKLAEEFAKKINGSVK